MAQWEARDPRWLVEERPDGVNPGGWHWQERDMMAWTRKDLETKLLVVSAALPDGGGLARVTKVASVEGEASISTRKGGKRFAAYDLTLSLEWEVVAGGDGEGDSSSSGTTTGTLKLSEVTVGHEEDDVLMEAGSGPAGTGAAVIKALKPGLLDALKAYAAALDAMEL